MKLGSLPFLGGFLLGIFAVIYSMGAVQAHLPGGPRSVYRVEPLAFLLLPLVLLWSLLDVIRGWRSHHLASLVFGILGVVLAGFAADVIYTTPVEKARFALNFRDNKIEIGRHINVRNSIIDG